MRISTNFFHNNSFTAINNHQNSILEIQEKLNSGKRVNRPSDDPVATPQIHALNTTMNSLTQFETNGEYASSQLTLEETQMDSAIEVTQRARELAIQMMNETYSPSNRQATAQEIGQLIDHLASLMNSVNSEGELLFGGSKGTADRAFVGDAPNSGALQPGNEYFSYIGNPNAGVDFDARANFGARFVQIGFDPDHKSNPNDEGDPSRVRISDQGGRVFGITGATSLPPGVDPSLINVLVELKDNLDQGLQPPAQIGDDLLKSIQDMSIEAAKIGSRQNKIEAVMNTGQDITLALKERRSDIEDQDVVEGITDLTRSQTALQMAQQVFTRVQGLSLFDYLR